MHVNDSKTTDSKAPRLLVAMEMSLKTWRLAMAVEGQPKKRVKTVEAGHYLELVQAVADAKERFTLPEATPVVFCYEAGRDGFYPYRRLTELGHEVWVIDSASIEVSRKKRRAKSDGIDADKLSELMQRQARGEKALRVVRVPPLEVEDVRLLPRKREMLLEDLQRMRATGSHRYCSPQATGRCPRVPGACGPGWRHRGRWAHSCGSGSNGTSRGFRSWRQWKRPCS